MRRGRKMNRHLAEIDRQLYAFNLFELFDPALHNGGLGSVVAKATDKIFLFRDFFLLFFIAFYKRGKFLFAQLFIPGVGSAIQVQFSVKQLVHFLYGYVEKIPVVTDQKIAAGKVGEPGFKPVSRFYVEIVRRFVKKENVRLFQEHFGQRDAHLPAAGKFVHRAREVVFREAETEKGLFHDRFAPVPARFLESKLYLVMFPGKAERLRRIRRFRGKLVAKGFVAREKIPPAGKSGFHLVGKRFSPVHDAGLGQVRNTGIFFNRALAAVRLNFPADDLHERGFPRSVYTGKRGTGS